MYVHPSSLPPSFPLLLHLFLFPSLFPPIPPSPRVAAKIEIRVLQQIKDIDGDGQE